MTPPAVPAANGQAYRAYLESALAILEELEAEEYLPSELPAVADEALAEIVSAFTAWPLPVRERFVANLPPKKRGLFGLFGHRSATLAVRGKNGEQLRLGLIGNIIANSPIPPNRNVDAALAVFYHCAKKLGMEPQTLFDDSAQFATEDMAARLIEFGRRADVTLKQYGWREIRTPEGVCYKFEF